MKSKQLVNALKQIPEESELSIMLEGSDYGTVAGVVEHNKSYFLCTQFELRKLGQENVITGEPDGKEKTQTSTKKTNSGNAGKNKQ